MSSAERLKPVVKQGGSPRGSRRWRVRTPGGGRRRRLLPPALIRLGRHTPLPRLTLIRVAIRRLMWRLGRGLARRMVDLFFVLILILVRLLLVSRLLVRRRVLWRWRLGFFLGYQLGMAWPR